VVEEVDGGVVEVDVVVLCLLCLLGQHVDGAVLGLLYLDPVLLAHPQAGDGGPRSCLLDGGHVPGPLAGSVGGDDDPLPCLLALLGCLFDPL
jgi:hypothetical protein